MRRRQSERRRDFAHWSLELLPRKSSRSLLSFSRPSVSVAGHLATEKPWPEAGDREAEAVAAKCVKGEERGRRLRSQAGQSAS